MPRPFFPLMMALTVALPATVRAECPDRADRLFAHPYGEPASGCREQQRAGSEAQIEHEDVMKDPRDTRTLRTLGVTGMGAGTALAGLGGASLLMSMVFSDGTSAHGISRGFGIGAAIAGGAVFLTGATLIGIDALVAPAPTPDRRGAQLMVAFRFP